MLLTDRLVDDLQAFRLGFMRQCLEGAQTIDPTADGRIVGSGFAAFYGDGSPLTQAYGLGFRSAPWDLEEIETFYEGRATNWELIATPFTAPDLVREAEALGYRFHHFETVLGLLAPASRVELPAAVRIEEVPAGHEVWMRTSEAGFSDRDELLPAGPLAHLMGAHTGTRRYLATVDGEPAGAAALGTWCGLFLFAGASTLPKFRGRGIQKALSQRRLSDAGEGSFVQVVTLPGSQSHRNAQRTGFEPVYSKVIWMRH